MHCTIREKRNRTLIITSVLFDIHRKRFIAQVLYKIVISLPRPFIKNNLPFKSSKTTPSIYYKFKLGILNK